MSMFIHVLTMLTSHPNHSLTGVPHFTSLPCISILVVIQSVLLTTTHTPFTRKPPEGVGACVHRAPAGCQRQPPQADREPGLHLHQGPPARGAEGRGPRQRPLLRALHLLLPPGKEVSKLGDHRCRRYGHMKPSLDMTVKVMWRRTIR